MTDSRDFNDLLQRLDHRITLLIRRWSFDPDVRSEAVLSLWRHYVRGVVDEHELCRRMDADVRCYVRREATQRSIPNRLRSLANVNDTEVDLDRLIARADAVRVCASLDMPDRARHWVDKTMRDTPTPVAASERMAGQRWSKRVRKRLPWAGSRPQIQFTSSGASSESTRAGAGPSQSPPSTESVHVPVAGDPMSVEHGSRQRSHPPASGSHTPRRMR